MKLETAMSPAIDGPMFKIGDEQGGVRISPSAAPPPAPGTGSLSPASPPPMKSGGGDGGWPWKLFAIALTIAAIAYIAWVYNHPPR
ncbi:MAG TPA: hypothetical protein VMU16_14000 [Candidatus Binataceae bacterium]|nr:hypothetical protein [Candidatus Binataceae bacterium]